MQGESAIVDEHDVHQAPVPSGALMDNGCLCPLPRLHQRPSEERDHLQSLSLYALSSLRFQLILTSSQHHSTAPSLWSPCTLLKRRSMLHQVAHLVSNVWVFHPTNGGMRAFMASLVLTRTLATRASTATQRRSHSPF